MHGLYHPFFDLGRECLKTTSLSLSSLSPLPPVSQNEKGGKGGGGTVLRYIRFPYAFTSSMYLCVVAVVVVPGLFLSIFAVCSPWKCEICIQTSYNKNDTGHDTTLIILNGNAFLLQNTFLFLSFPDD